MNPGVKRLLLDVVLLDGEQDAAPSLEDMARRAKGMLDAVSAKRQRRLKKTLPARRAKADRALAELEAHRQLRQRAFIRAMGRCELCDVPLRPNEAVHLHHLEGGPAKAKNERISNVMVTHPTCHEAYHLNVAAFVDVVRAWCQHHFYPLPKRKEFRRG